MTPVSSRRRFVAGTFAIIPGFVFFVTSPPPLLVPVALTGGLALAMGALGFSRARLGQRLGAAAGMITLGFLLAVIYGLAREYTTVGTPTTFGGSARIQIGFHTQSWSLTTLGQDQLAKEHDSSDLEFLALACGIFRPHGAERCWTQESILSAGVMLILLFSASVGSWAYGFGLLSNSDT